jgi:hypothetical protein
MKELKTVRTLDETIAELLEHVLGEIVHSSIQIILSS